LTETLEGVLSGQILAGVIMPGPDDVGVGSRLLGARARRAAGANGHTVVRHAVDATLLGVTSGFDCGDATGNPPQEVGAASGGFVCTASRGSISFGC
jgi:hypothetical protein